jgi:hypothetical protein
MGQVVMLRSITTLEFKEMVEDGWINCPEPNPLPHDNIDIPYFLVGDDDFGLTVIMMKPYSQSDRIS